MDTAGGGPDRGAVLITGASSGLGQAMAKGLAEHGYHVFAGVRRASDGRELEAFHPGLQSVILDVTEEKTVTDVAAFLAEELGQRGLGGLINNAGIALVGPLEYLDQEQWHRQFAVNVLGAVAVTREMLPLVRRGSGRLIFVGSIGGRLAPPLLGPYCASKYALEGLTEALRHELRPWGIPVVLLVPGTVRTAIWSKARDQVDVLSRQVPAEAVERYRPFFQQLSRSVDEQQRNGLDVDVVTRSALRAMTAAKPRPRYVIGAEAHMVEFLTRMLPSRIKGPVVARVAGFPSQSTVSHRQG